MILLMLKSKVKSEIPSVTNLGKIAAPNVKINEVNSRICNITNLASTAALFAAQNKIPNFSNLVKKRNITQKLNKNTSEYNHDKYVTTQEFNKLTSGNFDARLAQANLASKSDFANFVKKTDCHDKLKQIN